jgi:hypothetical protein
VAARDFRLESAGRAVESAGKSVPGDRIDRLTRIVDREGPVVRNRWGRPFLIRRPCFCVLRSQISLSFTACYNSSRLAAMIHVQGDPMAGDQNYEKASMAGKAQGGS